MFHLSVSIRRSLINRLQSVLPSTKRCLNTPTSTLNSVSQFPSRHCSSSRIAESTRSPAEEPPKIVGFADVEEVRETGEPSGTICNA